MGALRRVLWLPGTRDRPQRTRFREQGLVILMMTLEGTEGCLWADELGHFVIKPDKHLDSAVTQNTGWDQAGALTPRCPP